VRLKAFDERGDSLGVIGDRPGLRGIGQSDIELVLGESMPATDVIARGTTPQ